MITINKDRFNAIKGACVCLGIFCCMLFIQFVPPALSMYVLALSGIFFAVDALISLSKSKKEVKQKWMKRKD